MDSLWHSTHSTNPIFLRRSILRMNPDAKVRFYLDLNAVSQAPPAISVVAHTFGLRLPALAWLNTYLQRSIDISDGHYYTTMTH